MYPILQKHQDETGSTLPPPLPRLLLWSQLVHTDPYCSNFKLYKRYWPTCIQQHKYNEQTWSFINGTQRGLHTARQRPDISRLCPHTVERGADWITVTRNSLKLNSLQGRLWRRGCGRECVWDDSVVSVFTQKPMLQRPSARHLILKRFASAPLSWHYNVWRAERCQPLWSWSAFRFKWLFIASSEFGKEPQLGHLQRCHRHL